MPAMTETMADGEDCVPVGLATAPVKVAKLGTKDGAGDDGSGSLKESSLSASGSSGRSGASPRSSKIESTWSWSDSCELLATAILQVNAR